MYGVGGGRHRRGDREAVVHLVFSEGGEVSLGADSPLARSIAELAALLTQR